MTESIWNLDSLKLYFDELRKADLDSQDKRFKAQETAIDKAESTRDTAINKAELSIEKKSDAVYVKLTDLQKAFSEVMLRPEIEGRLKGHEEKLDRIDKGQTQSISKGAGVAATIAYIIMGIGLLSTIISIVLNLSK